MADQEQVGFAGDAVAARLSRSFPLASVVGMDDIKEALLLGAVCSSCRYSALGGCLPNVLLAYVALSVLGSVPC